MKINNVFAGRPAWYDRAPLVSNKIFGGALAPHATTQRWTYTVPSGRKAMMENILSEILRNAVATTAAGVEGYIEEVSVGMNYTDVSFYTNGVGDRDRDAHSAQSILLAGNNVDSKTIDLSTGGTVVHLQTAKITEFDA